MSSDLSFFAPKRSFAILYHTLRLARHLAISSKKSLWKSQKKDIRGAKSANFMPLLISSSEVAMALATAMPTSVIAFVPASRRLYPLKLMGFQRGTFLQIHSTTSHCIRKETEGGSISGALPTQVSMIKSF